MRNNLVKIPLFIQELRNSYLFAGRTALSRYNRKAAIGSTQLQSCEALPNVAVKLLALAMGI